MIVSVNPIELVLYLAIIEVFILNNFEFRAVQMSTNITSNFLSTDLHVIHNLNVISYHNISVKKAAIMPELFNFNQKVKLEDFTLILPTVSVGNVPQLTIDLLITSLSLKKVATLWHPAIIPSVGPDPYEINGPEICTACELYINEKLRVAVLQLRSAIEFKLATKFFADLKSSLLRHKIKNIVILASSFDYELHVVSTNKFYYISNQDVSDCMKKIGVKPKEAEFDGKYLVHGAGFAVKLFETLEDQFECIVLIKYVSEGDNRPDAITTLEVLSKFVKNAACSSKDLKFPSSWSCVFGGPPPLGMY